MLSDEVLDPVEVNALKTLGTYQCMLVGQDMLIANMLIAKV
jgi:hypothetical protein